MALSDQIFNDIGGAVSDIFSSDEQAKGLEIKAQGDIAEGQEYGLASQLASQNEQFTEQSTAIKDLQAQREATMSIGAQQAQVAGAGFAESGSALDLLRSSAAQSGLQRGVLAQQGAITEAGYQEQAQSYNVMQAAANQAATSEEALASETKTAGEISAGIKGAAAVFDIATAAIAL